MDKKIPLSVPNFIGKEWKYIKECLDDRWVSSAGKFVELFESRISEYTKSNFSVACINGTSAIHISLLLAGVKPNEEVIVPCLTFIAPINAVRYCNANPIFMDCDDFFNLDIEKTIDFITKETYTSDKGFAINKATDKRISALLVTHVFGNAASLDKLVGICKKRRIKIIEDASESLGTFYTESPLKGKHTGTIGSFGCLSFNGNKIITAGGGGMILTDSKSSAEKAVYLTTQAKNDPLKYIHNEVGFNYRLSNLQAAVGVAQLEKLPKFLKLKKNIFSLYSDGISSISGLEINPVPKFASNNHWLNLLKIDKNKYGKDSQSLMAYLNKNLIESRPIWFLNHQQKPFKNFQNYRIENAPGLVQNSLCLPSSTNLKKEDVEKIIAYLDAFRTKG